MSYQRPSEGRYYVWMGNDGLHVMATPDLATDLLIKHGPHGKANAKALVKGLVDFLASEGVEAAVSKGKVRFTTKDHPNPFSGKEEKNDETQC